MGLGAGLSLKQAREVADKARATILAGIDPVQATQRARAGADTFWTLAEKVIMLKEQSLTNRKAAAQWRSTLAQYAKPLHALPIGEITPQDVVACLEPIWISKPETATRVAQRIRAIFDLAEALGFETRNPASTSKLKLLLPAQSRKVTHHKAVGLDDAQAAFKAIWERRNAGMGARALAYTVLTAARSGETRRLEWDWIEPDRVLMPVGSMKRKGDAHRIPLAGLAVDLLASTPRYSWSPLVFPSSQGGQISDMTLAAVHKRIGLDATVHGWRSTFREWCIREGVDGDVAEDALHHTYRTAVQSAYARSDLFDQRGAVMEGWAQWLMQS